MFHIRALQFVSLICSLMILLTYIYILYEDASHQSWDCIIASFYTVYLVPLEVNKPGYICITECSEPG